MSQREAQEAGFMNLFLRVRISHYQSGGCEQPIESYQ
jgi:hypothetical protein